VDHSKNQKQHFFGAHRGVVGNHCNGRELIFSADVTTRSNGRTMHEYSPSHRALYDNPRDHDVIALGRRISQVRLSSQYDHQESTSGKMGSSPTSGHHLISSPARRRVAECRAMEERMASESLSPTRRFPRMGTKSDRPCSWSPGGVLSSFIAAIVPDVASVSSPRRVVQPVNEHVSRSHRNSPLSSQNIKCHETVNGNRPIDEQSIRYVDREQASNNWKSGRMPTQSSPARNDVQYSGFNKIAGSPDTRNHRAMRFESTPSDTKWSNGEPNHIVNCVNDARYKFRESIKTTGNVQFPDASQFEMTASHLRQEVDRIHQLRHQQTNNLRSVTPVHDALREAPGDWNYQTKQDQLRRCSRHDDFQRACAHAHMRDDSSPAKPKRDREFQPAPKTNNNTINNNTNIHGPVAGGGRLQDARAVSNNSSQLATIKYNAMPMPPPSPAESDWVIRRRADGSRYVTKRRHSARDRILRERERRLAEERRSTTTATTTEDEETVGDVGLRWPRSGHHYTRDVRRTQLVASRERKSRRQKALLQRLQEEQRKQHQQSYNAVTQ